MRPVLGGSIQGTLDNSGDLNNCLNPGIYYVHATVTNAPIGGAAMRGLLIVYKYTRDSNVYYTQIFTVAGSSVTWIRSYYTTWSPWHEISMNIPLFYKDYNDIASLASAVDIGGWVSVSVTKNTTIATNIDSTAGLWAIRPTGPTYSASLVFYVSTDAQGSNFTINNLNSTWYSNTCIITIDNGKLAINIGNLLWTVVTFKKIA